MDYLSFADGYALTLIAQYPDDDWSNVTPKMSEDARKVAEAIIHPDRAKGEIRDAAQRLRQLGERARGAEA